jgi:putative acetyltransferase
MNEAGRGLLEGILTIRPESVADADAIFAVHAAAFPTKVEAHLVNALRANEKAAVSLVAELDGAVTGHILFSPVSIDSASACPNGVGLAPLAVWPLHQRKGIGAQLVEHGLDACRRAGVAFAVVLGEPSYYRRFGFRRGLDHGLQNEYGADEAFMAIELRPGALAGISGLVRYCPEFSSV